MDGLALLCNLHADGPLTLRRLRAAGVRDLRHLTRLSEGELAPLLRSSPSQAWRFAEEARQLATRLAEEPLEEDLSLPAGELPGEEASETLQDLAEVRPPGAREVATPAIGSSMFVVADVPAPPAPPGSFDEEALPAPLSPVRRALAAPGRARETPLVSHAVEGLDGRTCERLVAEGVRTLEGLVELAGLALSRRTGISYTKLLDLSYRAKLLLGGPAQEPAPELGSAGIVPRPPREERAPPPVTWIAPAARRIEESRLSGSLTGFPEDPGSAGPFV